MQQFKSVYFADYPAENTRRRNLKSMVVCQVTLGTGAGRIMKTGGRSHHTWWPYGDYGILTNCRPVNP